jgi:L-rhamnose mutarotase
LQIEFTTFRIIDGKEEQAKEWMRVLTARRDECVATLAREKMALESIFMYEKESRLFLSWYSIQGDNPADVESSEHGIDNIHCQFWDECIDTLYKPDDHQHVVSFYSNSFARLLSEID